jgi:glycosyltransferase involved in cell wall biosynthesis
MLIGIDGNEANIKERVGIGQYAYEVLRHLYQYQKLNIKYQIFLKDRPLPDLPKETDWWRYTIVGPRKFWTQIGLPLALFKDNLQKKSPLDVFFTPSHYAPRFCPFPYTISIMDLSFLIYPGMFKPKDLWQLKSWTQSSVKAAQKILTISQASKRDIIRYYQVPGSKVVVTYPGINNQPIKMETDIEKTKKKYGLSEDYILSVGTLQPRKNFVKLIESFNLLTSQFPNITLVIAGKKGWLYDEILLAPKKFGLQNKVKFLDYVPDEDLPGLYQGAACFVLVSLYEGFGLPALEAMRLGCPTVVSNVSSLPEVVGEAGILVDPHNTQDIARGISEVLNLSQDQRKEIVEKGKAQAAKFSWDKCARETLEVLKEVVKNGD